MRCLEDVAADGKTAALAAFALCHRSDKRFRVGNVAFSGFIHGRSPYSSNTLCGFSTPSSAGRSRSLPYICIIRRSDCCRQADIRPDNTTTNIPNKYASSGGEAISSFIAETLPLLANSFLWLIFKFTLMTLFETALGKGPQAWALIWQVACECFCTRWCGKMTCQLELSLVCVALAFLLNNHV